MFVFMHQQAIYGHGRAYDNYDPELLVPVVQLKPHRL